MQIKCLLELNCVCVLFLLTLLVRLSLLGPGGGRYQNTYTVKRVATMDLMLTVVGSGTKRERISCGALFHNGRHVTPRGCC